MKLPKDVTDQKVKIEKLVPGGQGIGVDSEGKKGFFWNALPGETVIDYTITKSKSHYFEAIATKLDNLSKERIDPRDDCYLSTSPWQIMNYDYELSQKKEILTEMFRQNHIDISKILGKVKVQTDGNEYYYRNKPKWIEYRRIEERTY